MPASLFYIILNNPLLDLIILVALVFLAWNLTLHWQIYQTRKKIKALFRGTKIADLEGVIFEQIKRLRQTEKNLSAVGNFCRQLEAMTLKSIQKVGVVRFNPFKDIGGDQSFSLAFLDAQNDGFVLSSLYSREGARIFTKPIVAGESKYPLTEEEKKAIRLAAKSDQEKTKIRMTK